MSEDHYLYLAYYGIGKLNILLSSVFGQPKLFNAISAMALITTIVIVHQAFHSSRLSIQERF